MTATELTQDTEAPERALFVRVGETLYGSQWQSDLARALGVSDRTVRYWIAGKRIPRGIWHDLIMLLDTKDRAMIGIASELRMRQIVLDD